MGKKWYCDGSLWAIVFLGLFFCMFPSINNSNDAYMYAGDIRQGTDLFYPHHLLFNAFVYGLTRLFQFQDTLSMLCFVNAFFAIGCLFLLRHLLFPILERRSTAWVLIAVGCSWGFMRYATEGETYIIPLFFSLLASYVAFQKQSVFWSSMWASLACLFHQIHIFWWIGLALWEIKKAEKGVRLKTGWVFLSGTWIIFAAYLLVFYRTSTDCTYFYQYVLHDYLFVDSVGFSCKQAFVLTPINFIRTFVQIHGYIYALLQAYPFFLIVILASVCLFVLALKRRKAICFVQKRKEASRIEADFGRVHWWIAFLQLAFAFLSNGNAEFMVIIPFALAIGFFYLYRMEVLRLAYLAGFICLWNMSVGLFPYHFIDLYPYKVLEKYIVAHPNELFVVESYPQLFNQLRYNYPGKENSLKRDDEMVPGKVYLTDRYWNQLFFSRFSFVKDEGYVLKEHVIAVDTLQYDLGKWIICREKFQ